MGEVELELAGSKKYQLQQQEDACVRQLIVDRLFRLLTGTPLCRLPFLPGSCSKKAFQSGIHSLNISGLRLHERAYLAYREEGGPREGSLCYVGHMDVEKNYEHCLIPEDRS